MMQPFEQFKENYIDRLVELKKCYLVSQTYTRAFDQYAEERKTGILLTDYDDLGLAKTHLNAVKHDKFGSLIDLQNEKHKQTILKMLQPGSDYCVYWSIVRDAKEMAQRLNYRYKDNMRRYIMNNTNWRISADETIRPSFQVTFGELFIPLKRGSQTIKVKFDEIEKS